MVLPLIPAVLIAVGAATGGSGLALGGKGALSIKKAQSVRSEAIKRYEARREQSESQVAATNTLLERLGRDQHQALTDIVLRMAEFLRRNERQVRENERFLVDGIDATMRRVTGLSTLDIDAASWIAGAIGSAGAGFGASAGVTAAASTFGVASTGAAISGLSGVAASNAALAFLGGGSLASGGGGMALGAAALNFVTIGPGLLVAGFVTHTQGDKAMTKAKEVCTKVEVGIAELDEFDTKLAAVNMRADELRSLLGDLRGRAVAALDLLESEPFDAKTHAPRFQRAMTLAMAVRDVAASPVVDEAGDLTEESAKLSVKYRAMTEENANA
ncbi:hypothetical protein [Mycolicibacterium fortuitum]|nr:hypothetical protein [Mycolicibacterium fortuitum]OBB44190.1 hypothetical protein A5754_00775 [Mycolicibacterium fortuitum]OBB79717.1 hypothetical protein A5755_07235 [Mycolicibacterium fortuitum]OBF67537.1 hypothetical protein A5751_01700 [Mycolicibacterium fortuitum]OBG11518.1 hypothetical protein A5768_11755 [Mycolicibacterium fortuitum]OBI76353.1 hypothetical protein A5664_22970 [Mycolicibacterium fortuitum]